MRDGARDECEHAQAQRQRAASGQPLGGPHARAEQPRQNDRDDEADERGEDEQQHRVSARDRSGVERAAAEADDDRGRRSDCGHVRQPDTAPALLVVSRQGRRGQHERHRGHSTRERPECPAREQSVGEDRSDRLTGGARDRSHDRRADGDAEQRARERHRADLGREREPRLPASCTAGEQAAALASEPAAQPDRGDDREPEQQRARLAADEDQAPGGDRSAPGRGQQLVVRAAQAEGGVRRVQRGLPTRLGGQDAADVPCVQAVRAQRREPGVHAVEGLERRQPLERVDARSNQYARRRGRACGGRRDVAEQARVSQLGDPHAVEPDVALVQARVSAAADLEYLTRRRRAGARQPARPQSDDLREPVDAGDLDQSPRDAQLPEEHHAARLARRQRSEHAPHRAVLTGVRLSAQRRPEPVDAEALGAVRKRAERPAEGLLTCDQAAADDRDSHREGERHTGDHEDRA